MTSYVTPKKGVEFITYIGLGSQASPTTLQSNPTIASGDFKVSKDGGALANLSTLPAVTPGSSKMVKITLSTSEMDADNVTVICSDAAGAEWCDLLFTIQTSARQIDDLAYPTVSGRGLDVSAGGEAGVDWANVGSPTTTLNLSGTTVGTANALGSNSVTSSVLADGAITASKLASNTISAAKIAADAITAIQSGLSTVTTAQVNAEVVDALAVDVIADSVATDGSRPTIAQALLMITRFLMEKSVSSTTVTVRKEDGSSSSMTFTLNSATDPTSITRAT